MNGKNEQMIKFVIREKISKATELRVSIRLCHRKIQRHLLKLFIWFFTGFRFGSPFAFFIFGTSEAQVVCRGIRGVMASCSTAVAVAKVLKENHCLNCYLKFLTSISLACNHNVSRLTIHQFYNSQKFTHIT